MGKRETRLWEYIVNHRLFLLIAMVTVLSFYARFALRGIISRDMKTCLLPWYEMIRTEGGLSSLSKQVGDYNIPYQTLIALMTYLPVKPEYAYKALSIVFDYALGTAAAAIVYEITRNRLKAALAYTAAVSLPAVILNSSAWGQCDSIFTFFLAVAFLALLRKKNTAAFLLYGFSFAFKLQAVFFLPFLLFFYVWSRKFSAWRFLLIPLPLILLSSGGLIHGRSIWDVFGVYLEQTTSYPEISLGYPSFWNLILENGSEVAFAEIRFLCVMLTVIVLCVQMAWLVRKNNTSQGFLLLTAVVMMFTCILFLPRMHERYAYPVVLFTVMACFVYPGASLPALGLLIIDLRTYGRYLFFHQIPCWDILVFLNIACYTGLVYLLQKNAAEQGPTEENQQRQLPVGDLRSQLTGAQSSRRKIFMDRKSIL